MRFLNKIIFINSAGSSIPYAEVCLDGNVHFIGTQGVGKSTLLRSILFFYNADTRKLGIREGQKTYTEFYYPVLNSYIIYEVKTDNGFFTILTFKHKNQIAFRFIDSEYRKENYIANGKAFESWEQIRDSLDRNIHYSTIVSKFTDYRDIIYGNNKEIERKFRNYFIFESKQYQKVPLTISNVFLNTKLDASVIKQTIISSLNEENEQIELVRYTNHLKDFENDLKDIQRWESKDSHGISIVEKLAEKIGLSYNRLVQIENDKQNLASQLGYAVDKTRNEKPEIENNLKQAQNRKTELDSQINTLRQNFDAVKSQIDQKIGRIKGEIEKAQNKQQFYESKDIQSVIARVGNENNIISNIESLKNEKSILTDKFSDIERRFNEIIKQYENNYNSIKNRKESEKNSEKETYLSDCDNIKKQSDNIIDDIRKQSKTNSDFFNNQLSNKNEEISEKSIELAICQKEDFYKKEIDDINREIDNLSRKIYECNSEISQSKEKKEHIIKKSETEKKLTSERYEIEIEKLNTEKNALKKQSEEIKQKLDNFKGSFYDWLNHDYNGWENTIGQIINDDVLFNKNLNPQKSNSDCKNLYGVEIDLNEIGRTVKTIDDYNIECKQIEDNILDLSKQISNIELQRNEEIEKLESSYKRELKNLSEHQKKCEFDKQQSEIKKSSKEIDLKNLKQKAIDDKNNKLAQIKEEQEKLNNEKKAIEEKIKEFNESIESKVNQQKSNCSTQLIERQKKFNNICYKIDDEIKKAEDELNKKRSDAQSWRENELKSKGADTNKINEIDSKISKCNAELCYIKENRKLASDYQKDKEELFDKMPEFLAEKEKLQESLNLETQKHKVETQKVETELNSIKQNIKTLLNNINTIKNELDAFDKFTNSNDFMLLKSYIDNFSDLNRNDNKCSDIIGEINTKTNSYNSEYESIRENVNKFTGYFSDNNIFKFKTKCNTKDEYFSFADNLDEFIRENKFAEFRKRFHDRFANIINLIGDEIQQFINKSGEIEKIVNEINKDFSTRNFIGAINTLELRTTPSENRIYKALVEIKKFHSENQSLLGESNLFNLSNVDRKNSDAVNLLIFLSKEISESKEDYITLSDSFELEFRIVENGQDSGWVQKLSNVGSEGTDILIKAMINIMLLNVFKERSIRKTKSEFKLHCMMDEIGKLHSSNIKGILNFANERNIILINSSPNPTNPLDYKYTYILRRSSENKTSVTPLISKQ